MTNVNIWREIAEGINIAKLVHNLCAIIRTQAYRLFGLLSIIHVKICTCACVCMLTYTCTYVQQHIHMCNSENFHICMYMDTSTVHMLTNAPRHMCVCKCQYMH